METKVLLITLEVVGIVLCCYRMAAYKAAFDNTLIKSLFFIVEIQGVINDTISNGKADRRVTKITIKEESAFGQLSYFLSIFLALFFLGCILFQLFV